LDDIKGIGTKSAEALLTHFKSVKRLTEADIDEIAAVVGPAKASLIYNELHPE
jgi:excinuclease ABC subunit C